MTSNNDIKTDYLQGLMRQDIKRLTTKEEQREEQLYRDIQRIEDESISLHTD